MTKPIIIDTDTCIVCGECVRDCPTKCLAMEDNHAVYAHDRCMECGHCFAICPVAAIDMRDYDTEDVGRFYTMDQIGADDFLAAIKSRRSIRHFKDKKIEEEKVELILEAGRHIQTAKNIQDLKFTLISENINQIENEMIKALAAASGDQNNTDKYKNYLFKGAPMVIVISGENEMDAGIATAYLELFVESLGLGALVSGYSHRIIEGSAEVKKLIHMSEGHRVQGVLVVGYPDVTYHRPAPRKSANYEII